MGVAGLWDILKPAAKTRSLTDLAIKEGFEANPDGKRGFRLGIDASIWFFHAEYGREGENPELRTLFFRCATLMHTTFLPLFVFDGPKRPEFKRGKKINRMSHKLVPGMKQIVEAFGFEWRMAPGEAEAELAYLNQIGAIDGVLSDDVDNFLFGATTVVRNASNTLSGNKANPTLNSAGKDDKNHTRVFRLEDITAHPDVQLKRGGLILIGLMSGGDYQQGGLMRCGPATAHGLAKCGFGDSLYDAAVNLDREDLAEFIVHWRNELRQELRTNSKGLIGRKYVALANSITEKFPDIDILLSYVKPITSESMGRPSNNLTLTWSKEPDLPGLAYVCEFYFEWGYKEAIIKRFRTVMWHSIVLRILRRAVLDQDEKQIAAGAMPATPRKKNKVDACGTPSKMIAKHFSSLALESPSRVYLSGSESEDDVDENRLILKVHSSRTHTSTDALLEYRLEIAPKQLVQLAETGIRGLRVPEGEDEWASEEDEDGESKKGKGQPIDPETRLRLWMPACMVKLVEPRLVEEFEDKEEQKRAKKAKKGTRGKTAAGNDNGKEKEKAARKTRKPAAKPTQDVEDVFLSPAAEKPRKAAKVNSARTRALSAESSTGDEYDLFDDDLPSRLKENKHLARPQPQPAPVFSQAPETPSFFSSSPVSTRTGIRDLTKKKSSSTLADLKSFYPVTKASKTTILNKDRVNAAPSGSQTIGTTQSSYSTTSLSKKPVSIKASSILTKGQHTASSGSSKKGKAPAASKPAGPSRLKSLYESDNDSLEEYDAALLTSTLPAANRIPPASPTSKRKQAQRKSTSASSDSEPAARLQKSPRKQVGQTAAQHARRPTSPSPSTGPPSRLLGGVIEISDSESETDRIPAISSDNLPPLLAARARAKTSLNLDLVSTTVPKPAKQQRKVPPVLTPGDIIDLTDSS